LTWPRAGEGAEYVLGTLHGERAGQVLVRNLGICGVPGEEPHRATGPVCAGGSGDRVLEGDAPARVPTEQPGRGQIGLWVRFRFGDVRRGDDGEIGRAHV